MNLFVGNLSPETNEQSLEKAFSEFGEILSIKVIRDNETGMSKGFAFVEMADKFHAFDAIDNIDMTYFEGQVISVKEAKPKAAPGGGNRGGGGFNRGGGGGFNRGGSGGSGSFGPRRPSTGGGFNRDRPAGGGGFNRDRNSGGGGYSGGSYNRDNGNSYNRERPAGGGFNRDSNGGGYNRDNNSGGFNRDDNRGNYNRNNTPNTNSDNEENFNKL